MKDKTSHFIDTAKDRIQVSIRTLYFPEIWYILENYFSLAKVKRVLEVGSGIGLVSEALAKSGWDVTCVDPSLAALSDLKSRFDRAGVSGNFEQSEPDLLPFPNNSFDYVVSINMIEFTRDPNAAIREMARVLHPGGKAVIATFNKFSPWGLPVVARTVRHDEMKRSAQFLSKGEFKRLVKINKLELIDLKERAAYLPATTRVSKFKLPLTGAFVALVTKPEQRDKANRPAQKS